LASGLFTLGDDESLASVFRFTRYSSYTRVLTSKNFWSPLVHLVRDDVAGSKQRSWRFQLLR
jgi:hypothetical protein